jgi:hypothetical protein
MDSSLVSQNVIVSFTYSVGSARRRKCNGVERGDFLLKIRAELIASVEKSGWPGSRTNVVFKREAESRLRPIAPDLQGSAGVNIAPHTGIRGAGRKGVRLRRSSGATV